MKAPGGTTLLEALVALTLISLGGLQAMVLAASARDAERRATAKLEAVVLAEYVVTQIRLGMIDANRAVNGQPQSFAEPFDEFEWSIAHDTIERRIEVMRVSVSGALGSAELLVAACRNCVLRSPTR